MMPHLASGNNVTLFDHNTEREGISLTCDQGARYVVALQYYGLGGLSGIPEKFTAAPSCRGISFFVMGKNLFETLVLNMIHYTGDDDRPIPSDGTGEDMPSWEMDDPFQKRDEPYGLLDYLTWQNRRVLLIPTVGEESITINNITEAPGLRMSSDFLDGVRNRDPYQYYYRGSKNEPFVLRFQLEREVWRNSATILRHKDELAPPENIRWLQELARAGIKIGSHTCNLEALGMVSDKAKVFFYKRDSYPLPLEYIEKEDLVISLEKEINIAEEIGISLHYAVEKIATYLPNYEQKENGGNKKEKGQIQEHLNAVNNYWSKLEPGFVDLITHLPRDVVSSELAWQETVRAAAREALEHALRLAGTSAGGLKAGVHARAILEKNIREKLPLLYKEVTNEHPK
jgi:CRISPR system Cascade subunit CasA